MIAPSPSMMSTPSAQAKAFSTQALTTSMESGNKPLREQPIKQDILKALAPHPQGITESELISQTNLPNETLQAALKTLKDHDVIRSQKTNEIVNWAIAVELFRTWVVKYKRNPVDS